MALTFSDIDLMRHATVELRKKLHEFLFPYGDGYNSVSQAAAEINSFPKREVVASAYSSGSHAIQVSADLLLALTKMLENPLQTIAPFQCARSMLESGALAWILHHVNAIMPEVVAELIMHTGLIFARPIWSQCCLYGWNSCQLVSILQEWADHLKIPAAKQFWKSAREREKTKSTPDFQRAIGSGR